MSTPILTPHLNSIPSASINWILLSPLDLSNLKSGIPNRNKPPVASALSKTETAWPTLFNWSAGAKSAGPKPTTAIFFPVLFAIFSALTQPFKKLSLW